MLVLAGGRCVHLLQWHSELLIVHHHGQQSCLCACSRSKVPIAPTGKLLTCLLRLLLAQLRPTLRSTTVCTCRRDLEFSYRPDGKNADALALILACTTANGASVNNSRYVPKRPRKFPSPRWDFHRFLRLCLQGGGVYINGGTVSFSSCTITGNSAGYVRAHAQKFPSPRWESC